MDRKFVFVTMIWDLILKLTAIDYAKRCRNQNVYFSRIAVRI